MMNIITKNKETDVYHVCLSKGMTNKEVNDELYKHNVKLKFINNTFESGKISYNWICECGNIIEGRKWDNIKRRGSVSCEECKNKIQDSYYKSEIEKDGDYEYFYFIKSGAILSNGKVSKTPYARIKHKYCGNVYDVLISNFINAGQRCGKCCGSYENSLEYHYPEVAKMIVYDEDCNEVDTKTISKMSGKRFYFRCDKCGEVSDSPKQLASVVELGYSCGRCSDGISIPEKFVTNVLSQINIEFIRQKRFKWAKKDNKIKIYDFYIPSLNMIIETHGDQHYNENRRNGSRTLQQEKQNDKIKKQLALDNGIINYIVVDCRESTPYWLKQNMLESLSDYLDFKNVNWDDVWKFVTTNLIQDTWDLWNDGFRVKEICSKLYLNHGTVSKYLNIGNDLGKCKYDYIEKNKFNSNQYKLTNDNSLKVFYTSNDICKYLNICWCTFDKNFNNDFDIIDINKIENKKVKNKLKIYDGYTIEKITYEEYKKLEV